MSVLITATNRYHYTGLMDQYFMLREKVFNQWLGWGLDSVDGREFDQFDRADTVYILALGEQGRVTGGARLVPTTGDFMVSSLFPEIWEDQEVPRDPHVWEMSRFAVDWDAYKHDKDRIRVVSGELSCAITEFCVLNDVFELVGIFELRFERRVRKAFGDPLWMSQVHSVGTVPSVGARYRISFPHLRSMRERYHLPSPSISQLSEVLHA